jgi:hypothetical protein
VTVLAQDFIDLPHAVIASHSSFSVSSQRIIFGYYFMDASTRNQRQSGAIFKLA